MCRQPLKLVGSCSPSDMHSNVVGISGNTHENTFSRVYKVQSSNFLEYVHLKIPWLVYIHNVQHQLVAQCFNLLITAPTCFGLSIWLSSGSSTFVFRRQ